MTNTFTLEDLKAETKRRFAPFTIGLSDGSEVTLSSALRLSADDRKSVHTALKGVTALKDEDDSPETVEALIEAISKIFYVIADKPSKLLSDLDDDDQMIKVTLMSRVLSAWAKETQLGEALNSPA